MKYKLNEFVTILKTHEEKKVVDSELIDNQEIYYMHDNTSYHSSEILPRNVLSFQSKKTSDYFQDFYKSYISSMSKKMRK